MRNGISFAFQGWNQFNCKYIDATHTPSTAPPVGSEEIPAGMFPPPLPCILGIPQKSCPSWCVTWEEIFISSWGQTFAVTGAFGQCCMVRKVSCQWTNTIQFQWDSASSWLKPQFCHQLFTLIVFQTHTTSFQFFSIQWKWIGCCWAPKSTIVLYDVLHSKTLKFHLRAYGLLSV